MRAMVSRRKTRQKSPPKLLRNRYFRDSKLGERTFLKVLRGFADDLSASQAARSSGVSLRSVNDIYVRLRDRIWEDIWIHHDLFNGMGRYLRICAGTHVRRERALEYEGNPFAVAAGDGPHHSAAVTDALEVKEELFKENIRKLWNQRKLSRRLAKAETKWAHVVEIYAREKCGTLNRPRDHDYVTRLGEAILQAKQRRDDAECWRLLDEYEKNRQRFEYRGAGNRRFFDELKRMLKLNPL